MIVTLTRDAIKEYNGKLIEERTQEPFLLWHKIAFAAVLLIVVIFNFYGLNNASYPNLYYAAAIKSMLQNWHNFFFVSFDPGGFVTVDKPPLGFWIQVLSAKIFGFSAFSILLPEALAGVFSVIVLFQLVRRVFGPLAGLIAALVLALTPISVVTNRNNTIDSLLILTVLLAAWAVCYAAETGRLRWLLVCALLVGLGFNIKMLQAYLVVPAFGLVYLLGAPLRWRVKIGHLSLALLLMLVVSLSWSVIVDLTPANQRPYVGSSGTNSELNLAFGYNGIQRLTGMLFGGGFGGRGNGGTLPGGGQPPTGSFPGGGSTNGQTPSGGFPGGGGPGGAGETGTAGILRFFNQQMGGQISWLLVLALFGALAVGLQRRIRLPLNRRQQALALWGTWLLTMLVFFSVAGFFHLYYLSMVAPAIAALVGAGIVTLWREYRASSWRGWLLPLALLATAATQVYLLSYFPQWGSWLSPIILVLSLIMALVLLLAKLLPKLRAPRLLQATIIGGLLTLLIAPTTWSILSLANTGSALPAAGPSQRGAFPTGFTGGEQQNTDTRLIQYLLTNRGSAKYMLATLNANTAAPIILATGQPVMALGGFIGSDQIVTQAQLIQLIDKGTVRFFLLQSFSFNADQLPAGIPPAIREELEEGKLPSGLGGPGGFGAMGQTTQWVSTHCTKVPPLQWQSNTATDTGFGGAQNLYDCANNS